MATIEKRGAYHFCAKIRIRGVAGTWTFEAHKAAEDWARRLEGKIIGEEYEDTRAAKNTPKLVCDSMT
ncbi:hypothetical protein [Arenibaculum sp.]|uniref:hypothetical protein n=1 Tax=Arenibaculum sp. TaxID=2865862 RepID=UPI002E150480|nr:hypothetical protein [Arenibaculum sp.]